MYSMKPLSVKDLEEQAVALSARVNELEAALYGGRTGKLELFKKLTANNISFIIIGSTINGPEIVGVYLDEEVANDNSALAREVYDEVRVEPWLLQVTEAPANVDLVGRTHRYMYGQKVAYYDEEMNMYGTGHVLSSDHDSSSGVENILYRVVPEGFPFTEQYSKVLLSKEIKGIIK